MHGGVYVPLNHAENQTWLLAGTEGVASCPFAESKRLGDGRLLKDRTGMNFLKQA